MTGLSFNDVVTVLAAIASCERRPTAFTETDVKVWQKVFTSGGLPDGCLDDALEVVAAHHAASPYPIKPFDVVEGVKEIRRGRLGDAPDQLPTADPDDWAAYLAELRSRTAAAAAPPPRRPAIQGGGQP